MFRQVIWKKIKDPVSLILRFRHGKPPFSNTRDHSKCEKITICGAGNALGQHLAFLLKKQEIFKEVALYDQSNVRGLALDLEHMNSRTKIRPNSGNYTLKNALRHSDIIVIADGYDMDILEDKECALKKNANQIYQYGIKIASICPDALICILTPPINVMVPLLSEAMKSCNYYDPNKIFGVCSLTEMRANAIVSDYLGIDPAAVKVPVVGGASPSTAVPMLSHAKPYNEFSTSEALSLIDAIVEIPNECKKMNTAAPLSTAYAAARFVVTLAIGYCGIDTPVQTAFVRSNVMPNLKYFASGLRLGTRGAVANLGLPKVFECELNMLSYAMVSIEKDIHRAYALFNEIHREVRREEMEEICMMSKPFITKTPCPPCPPGLPDVCQPNPQRNPCCPSKPPEYVPSVCCCPK